MGIHPFAESQLVKFSLSTGSRHLFYCGGVVCLGAERTSRGSSVGLDCSETSGGSKGQVGQSNWKPLLGEDGYDKISQTDVCTKFRSTRTCHSNLIKEKQTPRFRV